MAPDEPAVSSWTLSRYAAVAVALLLTVIAIAVPVAIDAGRVRPRANEYNVAAWELYNLPAKWLYEFGSLFRDEPSTREQDENLLRFFELTRQIDALGVSISDANQRGIDADPDDIASYTAYSKERDRIENAVEATLEARLTQAARDLGLTRDFFILPDVWPPVDLEFTESPRTLATSRRDKIELKSSSLLRADLDISQVEAIEAQTEARDNVSALAFGTSGIGAYPTIVNYTTQYRATLELVGHEWTHNYLFFRPLGFNYYKNYDVRTMNETVANIVGEALADVVIARWPLDEPPREPSPAPRVDVGAVLRELRGEVDALLAASRIDDAEALMEQRREELNAQGARFRKLNQAYFAFTNLYAGSTGNAGVTNPVGPRVDELRRRSASLKAFVEQIASFTSLKQLDDALASP